MIAMFLGRTPRIACTDMADWLRNTKAESVQMLCSGGFHEEETFRGLVPGIKLFGNDVTLLPVVVGRFLMGDDHAAIKFKEKYEQLNECKSRALALCALDAALKTYRKRWKPTQENLDALVARANEKLDVLKEVRKKLALERFTERDMVKLIEETDAGAIIGAPPFFRGDYERMSKKLDAVVEWEAPEYELFDPKRFPELCTMAANTKKPWALLSCVFFPDVPLLSIHKISKFRSWYLYGEPQHGGLVTGPTCPQRFLPEADPDNFTENSVCELRPFTDAQEFQEVYYAYAYKGFSLFPANPLAVVVDGAFCGAFGFEFSTQHGGAFQSLYQNCEFAISNKRRLNKLVTMLSTASEVKEWIERTKWRRYQDGVYTVAMSDRPSTPKYRGTGFKRTLVKDNRVSYGAPWSGKTIQQIYRTWWFKHARKKRIDA